mmetsp:Transcript_61912/g.116556  ORF Transcript_61912/g.116556 Transcript_61912/m.116556 type:complete len:443 (+) Transcript_61912:55-1383(+)
MTRLMRVVYPTMSAFGVAVVHALNPGVSHTAGKEKPLLRFGVVADIQYANVDDGFNFGGTQRRHHRGSLAMLDGAVGFWSERKVDLVCQMGDIIDGKAKAESDSDKDLQAVLATLNKVKPEVDFLHLIGNHELYNFDRVQLAAKLNTRRSGGHPVGSHGKEYYRVQPCKGWRFLVLDPYQDAVIGLRQSPEEMERSGAILARNNPNFLPSGKGTKDGSAWFDGVTGEARRFVPYNGGFGKPQLAWLAGELEDAGKAGDRVCLLSHSIVHPKACHGSTMAWDFNEALGAIDVACRKWPGTVALVLSGHDHFGGYHSADGGRDDDAKGDKGGTVSERCDGSSHGGGGGGGSGVQYVTLKSPLNMGEEGKCFGCVDVYPDRLVLRGPNLEHLLHDNLLEASAATDPLAAATRATTRPPSFVDEATGDQCVELLLKPLRKQTGVLQ